jgi:glyoxylase-like metal-dependent hydrolase (beta-lactamase superfamily II)
MPAAEALQTGTVRLVSFADVSDLTWWFSPHPAWEPGEDWDPDVPVVRFETDDEVVLIDPFLPPDDSFDPRGKQVRVLLTQPAHYRGTSDFVERHRASVWAPPRAQWRRRPDPTTTETLPEGITAIELPGEPNQVVFYIPEHATLVTGDVLSGSGGRIHVFVDEADAELLLPALDALADLPIEQLIIPHGDLIPADGAARIREAVAEARRA